MGTFIVVDNTVEELDRLVRYLHVTGRKHKNRGYVLRDSSQALATCHLAQEALEFQEACIAPEGMKIKDKEEYEKDPHEFLLNESADIIAVWLHANQLAGLPLHKVVKKAQIKLMEIFDHA